VSEGYSLRDVSKLLGLSRSIVGRLIEAGFVTPARGRRREYRFSFQDLVVLRAARELAEARIPSARILRSLRRLRAQLPDKVPLTGLRIEAVGDSVVVNEGDHKWRPDDGQYVFSFQVEAPESGLTFVKPAPSPAPAAKPTRWFEQGQALEAVDGLKAAEAYRQAIAEDEADIRAYVNLGRLLHEHGRLKEAQAVYRDAIAKCQADGTLLFNLGVLLEDQGRGRDAAGAYRAALSAEPELADAHFNLARLCEAQGLRREALRHWSAYRKLTGSK
jgi:tetratricopeptide (TPR) repeat protein